MQGGAGEVEARRPDSDSPGGGGSEGGHQRHRWLRWILWTVLLIIVVLIGIWGVRKWLYGRHHESTDDAQIAGHLVPVLSRVGAFVAEVYIHDTEHVTAGELLVRLDDTDLRPVLAEAEAAVRAASAAAGGGEASAQVEEARQRAAAAGAQVDAARAQADRAERDLRRAEDLAPAEIISRQALDAAREVAATARASLRVAEDQALAALAAVMSAEAAERGAEARLVQARAAVEQAQLNLSYTQITSPVSGIVAKRSVDPGQYVEPGQPLMVIVADSGIHITANFKETQVEKIRPGQLVKIDIDAYGSCAAEGIVDHLGGATGSEFALLPPNNATGNFVKVVQRIPVRIVVTEGCGPGRRLRPGMSVTVHIRITDRPVRR